jgi:hypothetical protein
MKPVDGRHDHYAVRRNPHGVDLVHPVVGLCEGVIWVARGSLRLDALISGKRAGEFAFLVCFLSGNDCVACGQPVGGQFVVGIGEVEPRLASARTFAAVDIPVPYGLRQAIELVAQPIESRISELRTKPGLELVLGSLGPGISLRGRDSLRFMVPFPGRGLPRFDVWARRV